MTRSPATIPWFVAPMRDRCLPGQDARPSLDAGAERPNDVDELERGTDRALRIVLMGGRGAPDGHDGVADEFLDRAAVTADHIARQIEVPGEQVAGLLRVTSLGQGREARPDRRTGPTPSDARRRARHVPSMTVASSAVERGSAGGEWRRTLPAELDRRFVRRPARRTCDHERRGAFAAEPAPGRIRAAAVRADHDHPHLGTATPTWRTRRRASRG